MIPGTGDAYLDIANTYLLIRAKVVRGVGTDLADGTPVAPVNNWLIITESRVVEMMGRLQVDLFLQDRFLLNGVNVKIRLVRSKDAFSLMADGQNPDYKVQIVDAVLFARKAELSPTVQMAHIKAWEKGTAKYPIRPVDCKVYSIPQGAMSHTHDNLFLGTLPKRLILWCIDNDAYNGEYSIQRQEQRQ